jgi:hypothetical protein
LPAVVVLLFNGNTPFAAGPLPGGLNVFDDGWDGGAAGDEELSNEVELAFALGRSSGSIRAL